MMLSSLVLSGSKNSLQSKNDKRPDNRDVFSVKKDDFYIKKVIVVDF